MTIRQNLVDKYVEQAFEIRKREILLKRISRKLTPEEFREANTRIAEKVLVWVREWYGT